MGLLDEYRRLGISSRLMGRACDWASEYGYRRVSSSMPATNKGAIEFLTTNGWEQECLYRPLRDRRRHRRRDAALLQALTGAHPLRNTLGAGDTTWCMGYRCPVCADPQVDDTHLANHLAFTALVRGGDHEVWLDEHVPDWGEMGEDGLAGRVREHADSAEYPAVFEDTTDSAGGHDGADTDEHGHPNRHGGRPETADPPFGTGMDGETREVIERARELTRERRANATETQPDETTDGEKQ